MWLSQSSVGTCAAKTKIGPCEGGVKSEVKEENE
jgi:hypothetical protein